MVIESSSCLFYISAESWLGNEEDSFEKQNNMDVINDCFSRPLIPRNKTLAARPSKLGEKRLASDLVAIERMTGLNRVHNRRRRASDWQFVQCNLTFVNTLRVARARTKSGNR